MSSTTSTRHVALSDARAWQGTVWRIVESQHVAATMKLVDTRDEQDLLESLLDAGKPAAPPESAGLHYLLSTPFRYPPRHGGSRFRGLADPGVFYAAESVRTAAAELGYWRWKFLHDATELERLAPVAHTAFSAKISTSAVDLREPPFDEDAARWQHPYDYVPTQALGRAVRDAGIGGILYWSVRDPEPAWCFALLSPSGFAGKQPEPGGQTWYLAVSRQEVSWRRDIESMRFLTQPWQEAAGPAGQNLSSSPR